MTAWSLRFLACGLALAMCAAPARAQEQLTFAAVTDLDTRIGAEVLRVAYAKLGIAINGKELPAARALALSNDGVLDGEINRIEGMEKLYPNLIRVPVAIGQMEGVVFTKGLNFPVTGWDSLRPYRIGTRIGLKFAELGTVGMNVERVSTVEQSFAKLAAGRVDVVVEARLSGLWQLQLAGLRGIAPLEPPLVKFRLFHYLHKKHANLVPRITAVLEKMQADGQLQALRKEAIARYLGSAAPVIP